MRRLTEAFQALVRRFLGHSLRVSEGGLTAVEYEAVTLIAYEGQGAHARACEQAEYCRRRGSEDGFTFWSQVAVEVTLRTRGRIPEQR